MKNKESQRNIKKEISYYQNEKLKNQLKLNLNKNKIK